ncbi:adenosylcobinamide-GDP ribazoletransferase [Herbivorax sp. ANBcel31]|uniref:adenosylcobinamide-GDP ribazoletransferase n=1 Tax=Herbivorax sp. ANBcel31 TaxID=3069754 RepID=UPI0027B1BF77|nr:adenosylcobinamide-GDP ribazoletransferase [Herbivorax sp. ANBcel31]MDQ2085512.1 adenosylcobinamide-GDP ribazoletransferase [Herbivorax sp. ANBcel31]
MKSIKRFIMMVQFLTTIPIRVNIDCNKEDYGKGLVFAPLVGLIIGAVLLAIYCGLEPFFSLEVISVLIIIAYVFLTGGIHIDGLADTFDGLFSNRPKERMLEIMRDSRIGSNGVLAVVCLLLLNYTLIISLDLQSTKIVLLLFPVAGRIASLVGAGASKYARKTQGLGKSFIDFCGLKEIIIGSIIYMLIFYIAIGLKGLILAAMTIISSYIFLKLMTRKIQGATGDVLGALCEINQTCFLIFITLLGKCYFY